MVGPGGEIWTMDALGKQILSAIAALMPFAATGVGAIVSASALNQEIAAVLSPPLRMEEMPPDPALADRVERPRQIDLSLLLPGYVATGTELHEPDGPPEGAESGDEAPEVFATDEACPPVQLGVELAGTSASARAVWTFGVVRDKTTQETFLVQPGDKTELPAFEGRTLTAVYPDRLEFRGPQGRDCLYLFDPKQRADLITIDAAKVPAPAAETPKAAEGRNARFTKALEGIHRSGRGGFGIKRGSLHAILDDTDHAFGGDQGAVVQKNGAVKGIEFKSLRPQSPLRMIGLRSGDIVTSVNGKAIPENFQAKDVFKRMGRRPTQGSIEYLRKGRPAALKYTVEP